MGKRIRVQRRGRGGSQFRSPTHKRVAPAKYPPLNKLEKMPATGVVERLVHDPGRGAPLALIHLDNGNSFYNVACEGMYEDQKIQIGTNASKEVGNILPLSEIPEGAMVYNIEKTTEDGGKFARSSGSYANLISHTSAGTELKFPSGKSTYIHGSSLATLGVAAGGGRTDKIMMKAGERYHLMKAKAQKYPITKGGRMISALHPYGGGRHKHAGKPVTVSRDAPPGRKVGLIAARQTGRSKRRKSGNR